MNICSLCGHPFVHSNRPKDRICNNLNCVYGCSIPNDVEKYRYKCYSCKLKNAHVVSYCIKEIWYHLRLIQCKDCFKTKIINETNKKFIIDKMRKGFYDELKVFSFKKVPTTIPKKIATAPKCAIIKKPNHFLPIGPPIKITEIFTHWYRLFCLLYLLVLRLHLFLLLYLLVLRLHYHFHHRQLRL